MRSISPFTLGLILLPILELLVFIRVGSRIGIFATLLLMFAMTILGGLLVRQQGALALQRFKLALRNGQAPKQELGEGMAVLIGGILLLIPGFLTDILGLICLIPSTRPWVLRTVRHYLQRSGKPFQTPFKEAYRSSRYTSAKDDNIIEGEIIEPSKTKR